MSRDLIGKTVKSFTMTRQLGSGCFAMVFQAVDSKKNNIVAIKVMRKKELNKSKKLKELVQTEITVLKSCKNDNVIKFIDSFQTSQFLFIVTEFCNGGDLEEYIKKEKKLTEDHAIAFLKQILNGFKGLHEVGAMHRDFKAANVLLHDNQCKLADLGFSKQMSEDSIAKTVLGTSITMAPQILEEQPYGFEADIWSIGVVFYQMIYGEYPYTGRNDTMLLKNIKQKKISFDGVNISSQTKNFIQRCLTLDPKKRISWSQIYNHSLLKQQERKIVTPGILKSKLSIRTNRQFYKNDLKAQRNSIQTQAREIVFQILPDQTLVQVKNVQHFQKQVNSIKLQNEKFERFDNLYVSKRNDLMFFSKFVKPYLSKLGSIKLNHCVIGFLLSKKAYVELKKMHESMENKKNIFYNQSDFQSYSNQDSYRKLTELVGKDITNISKLCEDYKKEIKITTLDIKDQFDIKTVKSKNFDSLVNQIIGQYLVLVTESLRYVTGGLKNDVLRIIYSLSYYWKNSKPHENQFDRMVSTLNIPQYEKTVKAKYGIQ